MLHPSIRDDTDALAARWRDTGSIRIEPVLADDMADAVASALAGQPHILRAALPGAFAFQYEAYSFVPEPGCDHVLCAFGRWILGPMLTWVQDVTGLELGPPPDGMLVATRYTKGCFLDAHNDYDGDRRVAYVLGLTRDSWPAADGGHLEFLDVEARTIRVVERRPPGWNTLDLFDVRRPDRLHRVSLVRRAIERRAVSGWFHAPAQSP